MALNATNLLIQMARIPVDFVGTPDDLAAAMVARMKIVSPSGTNFIFIGDVEPTSNVGPWLKNGTQWFVWDESIKRYVPLDISQSETKWFHVGASTPTDSIPPLWLRTTLDPTEASPSYGNFVGWYVFDGTSWVPGNGIVQSGPTSTRPAAPVDYQQYYDTSIATLIWWERSAWRTVSGVPGDVKAVAFTTLNEALQRNPGWDVLGASNVNLRGRIVMEATKDSGATPQTDLNVPAGVAKRAAFEVFGETEGVKIDNTSPVPYPPQLALWHLVKG